MKGIILAGGYGTRLSPLTKSISKQLLPVYNKPMIYYSLSVLMLAGIREILIITDEKSLPLYKDLLGDGKELGISLTYKVQNIPQGVGEAFILGEEFIKKDSVMLILGDNIFYGNGFTGKLKEAVKLKKGAMIFSTYSKKPENFGVVEFEDEKIVSLEEKPKSPKSNYVVSGLYFFDSSVVAKAKKISKSSRGEYEIISILEEYLKEKTLFYTNLGRGMVWLDAGTFEGLLEAGNFIQTIEKQQGIMIGNIEEIAYLNSWIDENKLMELAKRYENSEYGRYLFEVAKDRR